jgi:Sigma-70 region 2
VWVGGLTLARYRPGGPYPPRATDGTQMTSLLECEVAERFLQHADEDSFAELFRTFSPQLIAFFRRRGHEKDIAEDLSQEVMLTVYRKAGQLRDHRLFRA